MVRLLIMVVVMLSYAGAAKAQSKEDLKTIMKGWAEKPFQILVLSEYDEESNKWEVEDKDGAVWEVDLINPLSGRFFSSDGVEFYVDLADGQYTVYSLSDSGERKDQVSKLLKAEVFGPNHWTIFVKWWKRSKDSPQKYAEMYMFGDMFVHTNYEDIPGTDQRRRVMFEFSRQID